MWEDLLHALLHTIEDTLHVLPFLLIAYVLIEWLEHKAGDRFQSFLARSGKFGSVIGGLLGMVPQCGFSVVCANFYAGRIVTTGTVVAVMLATSDEALPLLVAKGEAWDKIAMLLVSKLIIGMVTGLVVDLCYKRKESLPENELCRDCGCDHDHDHGFIKSILLPALRHVVAIAAFLFAVTFILNFAVELIGEDKLAAMLGGDSLLQPVICALFGFVPNCAASVVITELYVAGGLSFGSAVAGLCTGAGTGLLVLFRANRNHRENLFIVAVMLAAAVLSGVLLHLIL
ncbi:MAG: arsenic efflux protein [Clostridia bacterium]|nr:arsenic efflux protein [Clostridia bacterium]